MGGGEDHITSPARQPPPRTVLADAPATAEPAAHAPRDTHHEQGLVMARAGRWNWAQRELERAVRAAPDGPVCDDLTSVRVVRRELRVLQKWPRDVQAHLRLGQAYMELGLGDDAEDVFRQVIALAPTEPRAYVYLALEYAYRGATAEAERVYEQARAFAADLPSFSVVLPDWQALLDTPDSPPVSPPPAAQQE